MTPGEYHNLVLPVYGLMLRHASGMLGGDAQDAVQEVMVKLWEQHRQLSPDINVAAYCLKAIHNHCIDIIRKNHAVTVDVLTIADTEPEPGGDNARLLDSLDHAIDTLREPALTIIKMSLAGHSGKNIAQATGLSPENVRQILSRSRRQLRTYILSNTQRS